MHESSLAASLLRQVNDRAAENGGGRVVAIELEVGPLAGVEPTLLHEAFLRLRVGTLASDAVLHIDAVPLVGRCRACGGAFRTDAPNFACLACGERRIEIVSGDSVVFRSFTLETCDTPASRVS